MYVSATATKGLVVFRVPVIKEVVVLESIDIHATIFYSHVWL